MSTKKIYMTTQIPQWVQSKLAAHLPEFEVLRLSADNLMEHKSENVVGLMVRSQTQVSPKLINYFKDLKLVGTATSGFDHLDLKILKDKNILAFYTPDANIISTADLTLLHILMALRNNFSNSVSEKNFNWKHQLPLGQESQGKNLGILGLGRIGKEVAKRALSFGFKVHYHDPYLNAETIDL
jgi:D-3-phosphoglycerate dehydrogenase / 2-oxoglutarate reductase